MRSDSMLSRRTIHQCVVYVAGRAAAIVRTAVFVLLLFSPLAGYAQGAVVDCGHVNEQAIQDAWAHKDYNMVASNVMWWQMRCGDDGVPTGYYVLGAKALLELGQKSSREDARHFYAGASKWLEIYFKSARDNDPAYQDAKAISFELSKVWGYNK